jgi:hypothetical protein
MVDSYNAAGARPMRAPDQRRRGLLLAEAKQAPRSVPSACAAAVRFQRCASPVQVAVQVPSATAPAWVRVERSHTVARSFTVPPFQQRIGPDRLTARPPDATSPKRAKSSALTGLVG